MQAQDVRDAQQCPDACIGGAGFDLLVGGAGDAGLEENAFLGAVLVEPVDADAVADGAAFAGDPVVAVGQAGHASNALTKIIISQPGLPGIV
jgi:hypothetical protein